MGAGIENPPETVPTNLTASPEPEHPWQKEQERKLAAIARELMRVKWKQIDQLGPPDKDTIAVCGICGTGAPAGQLETLVSQCSFSGGELIRYRCPGCGAIFGPLKFSRLSQEEFDDDYTVHYTGYHEGDSTEAELYTFELLEPRKNGVYLNYGCGSWSSTLEILRQRGYQVYGYEPYADNAGTPYLITNRQALTSMRFDGIFSNNLLEHLRDPVSELCFMKTLLASSEAKMAHTTPCYRYLYEFTRFHTFFFTGRSVDVLCEKAGLRVVKNVDSSEEKGIRDFYCKIFEVKEG